jgi:hypothetical protein
MLPQLGGINIMTHPVNRLPVALIRHAHDEPAARRLRCAGFVTGHAGDWNVF